MEIDKEYIEDLKIIIDILDKAILSELLTNKNPTLSELSFIFATLLQATENISIFSLERSYSLLKATINIRNLEKIKDLENIDSISIKMLPVEPVEKEIEEPLITFLDRNSEKILLVFQIRNINNMVGARIIFNSKKYTKFKNWFYYKFIPIYLTELISSSSFINLTRDAIKFLEEKRSEIFKLKENINAIINEATLKEQEILKIFTNINTKYKDLKRLKEEIEKFLAKDVLEEVSKEYVKKASDKAWKFPKWSLFFTFSLILIATPLLFIPDLLDGKTWHDFLIKASIGFIPIVVGFYLLRYSLKLRDLQEEYKFKSIMLSSLPALSLLIDDKNERDKIITTILLEASNLQTLTKDKGEVVKEILPIVELANKLKNS